VLISPWPDLLPNFFLVRIFRLLLVLLYIYSTNIPPIMIINRICCLFVCLFVFLALQTSNFSASQKTSFSFLSLLCLYELPPVPITNNTTSVLVFPSIFFKVSFKSLFHLRLGLPRSLLLQAAAPKLCMHFTP